MIYTKFSTPQVRSNHQAQQKSLKISKKVDPSILQWFTQLEFSGNTRNPDAAAVLILPGGNYDSCNLRLLRPDFLEEGISKEPRIYTLENKALLRGY